MLRHGEHRLGCATRQVWTCRISNRETHWQVVPCAEDRLRDISVISDMSDINIRGQKSENMHICTRTSVENLARITIEYQIYINPKHNTRKIRRLFEGNITICIVSF